MKKKTGGGGRGTKALPCGTELDPVLTVNVVQFQKPLLKSMHV